jgi:hypothetical protein
MQPTAWSNLKWDRLQMGLQEKCHLLVVRQNGALTSFNSWFIREGLINKSHSISKLHPHCSRTSSLLIVSLNFCVGRDMTDSQDKS